MTGDGVSDCGRGVARTAGRRDRVYDAKAALGGLRAASGLTHLGDAAERKNPPREAAESV